MYSIDILMATYNGEKYIEQQISSIINQTYKNWRLIIRDDGSKDNTVDVVKKLMSYYPEKILLISDNKGGLGAAQNFNELLKYSTSDYCMFCDQDDFWFEDKVEKTLIKIRNIEEDNGKGCPVLIHTNLKVTDNNLNIISESFWEYQNLYPQIKELNRLLVQNNITGCTVMINKTLKQLAGSVPHSSLMHDWWIGLIAACFGTIDYIEEPTMLYRQHGNNDVGAQKADFKYVLKKISDREKYKNDLLRTQIQAKALLEAYKDCLEDRHIDSLKKYSELSSQSFFKKRLYILKYNFFKPGLLRNLGFIMFI
ncbi:MAG: glycosyltransferase family 2 protein [Clostridiaceae bacterium]|nr:glycosyltransferase family 2 protein [Clostridiaceae bacterium]